MSTGEEKAIMQYRFLRGFLIAGALTLGVIAPAFATPSPNGPGQPGAPGTTCGNANTSMTPGHSASSNGAPFNPNGNAGLHYAGNPGTASAEHSYSVHEVSQYDSACFQVTQH
jgi:hypothetical protein